MSVDIISNNPYRILGVYTNSSMKDIVANVNKAKAYINVGKEISFTQDFSPYLTEIDRTIETIDWALSNINLLEDKLKHALFWFVNVSSFDDIALRHLSANNPDKAKEILEKKISFSSLLNRAVIAISEDKLRIGIYCYLRLIHNSQYRSDFLKCVSGELNKISEKKLITILFNTLSDHFPVRRLLHIVYSLSESEKLFEVKEKVFNDYTFIKNKAISYVIDVINTEISIAKNVDSNPDLQLKAGRNLIEKTKIPLLQLKDFGCTDAQYQLSADKLAKRINQCGVNYYRDVL